eukprot:GHVU01056858.1.p1 GENE.GHVU01056858.1~~GHVU01056858.1.p1  ORF type:complete len:111 (-),score=0.37 GHVU01056858.1:88-420(-)
MIYLFLFIRTNQRPPSHDDPPLMLPMWWHYSPSVVVSRSYLFVPNRIGTALDSVHLLRLTHSIRFDFRLPLRNEDRLVRSQASERLSGCLFTSAVDAALTRQRLPIAAGS